MTARPERAEPACVQERRGTDDIGVACGTVYGDRRRAATIRYMNQPLSLRLAAATVENLTERARRTHSCALPTVRPGVARPLVGSGLDVWEVIATVRDNEGDIPASASYLEIPVGLPQAAVTYYGAYTAEIDEWIALNEREAAEVHAAWIAGQAALER
jgi:hypothetical protein